MTQEQTCWYQFWLEKARKAAGNGEADYARKCLTNAEQYGTVVPIVRDTIMNLARGRAKQIARENRFAFGGA